MDWQLNRLAVVVHLDRQLVLAALVVVVLVFLLGAAVAGVVLALFTEVQEGLVVLVEAPLDMAVALEALRTATDQGLDVTSPICSLTSCCVLARRPVRHIRALFFTPHIPARAVEVPIPQVPWCEESLAVMAQAAAR